MPTVTTGTGRGRRSDHRLVRVARGFLDPATRGRYAAVARDRLRGTVRRSPRCAICGAPTRVVTVRQDTASVRAGGPAKTFHMFVCRVCGFVGNPENTFDYRSFERVDEMANAARTGRADRPGREFYMAQMAADILGRDGLEVLVYGAGRSLDNLHIATLPDVRHVAIADVMQLRDDAEFIDANLPAPRRFGVVVASEVIEHFPDPRADLGALLDFVDPDGLLVCSTNLYDGGKLARQVYVFVPGHVSYWSKGSLSRVAAADGVFVDFRVPLVATGFAGPRKWYVLFTRSQAVMDSITRYFSTHEYAPSESPTADQELAAVTPGG